MELHWIDICVVSAYMLGLLVMGYYFSKKNTSTEEYFVGGRSYSGWVIGLSLIGTSISSISFLAYPADGFKASWIRLILAFVFFPCMLISAYVFLPIYRRRNTTTAYEFLEERYGPSVRTYAAIASLLGQIVRVSTVLYLLSLMVNTVTGIPVETCIIIAGIVVGLYTILGGIDAVIWTDVIQTIVLVGGGILVLIVIIYKLPGGLMQIFDVAREHGKIAFSELIDGKLKPIPWNLSLARKTGSMMLIMGVLQWLSEYGTSQGVVQRYAAAKSTKAARQALWVTNFNMLIWLFFMFLGTALFVFFNVFPTTETTEMLNGVRNAEQILPFFIIKQLPVGITGIVLAAAIAAAMSTIDTGLNSMSTVAVHDLYRRHYVKKREDKHYLRVAWLVSSVSSVLMIIGGLIFAQYKSKTLLDTITTIAGFMASGIFAIYMFGFFTKFRNMFVIWLSIGLALLFTLWTVLVSYELLPDFLTTPFDMYYGGIIKNLLVFLTALIGMLVVQVWKKRRQRQSD